MDGLIEAITVTQNTPITEENFEKVFKQYFGPLTNYINSYMKDWDASREVVQGTFLKIWESRDSLTITSSMKSYLYSSARNRMIDHIRSNGRLEEFKKNNPNIEATENSEEIDPFIIRQEVLKSIDKLKPKMKKIFSLSKIEGLTYSEIASYLGISKRSVEDNVARALHLLRQDLMDNELIAN